MIFRPDQKNALYLALFNSPILIISLLGLLEDHRFFPFYIMILLFCVTILFILTESINASEISLTLRRYGINILEIKVNNISRYKIEKVGMFSYIYIKCKDYKEERLNITNYYENDVDAIIEYIEGGLR